MIENLYTMIRVITYNLISLKTSFLCRGGSRTAATSKMECFDVAAVLDPPLLCYCKLDLPEIYFAYSAWTSFRDPSFDFEFESI